MTPRLHTGQVGPMKQKRTINQSSKILVDGVGSDVKSIRQVTGTHPVYHCEECGVNLYRKHRRIWTSKDESKVKVLCSACYWDKVYQSDS